MLRVLGDAMAKAAEGVTEDRVLLSHKDAAEMEAEFEASVGDLVELALSCEPNKASLIAEVELLKRLIGAVPTRKEVEAASRFTAAQYEAEFKTWGHMLDRLGYDPWYRNRKGVRGTGQGTGETSPAASVVDELNTRIAQSLEMVKSAPGGKGLTVADLMVAIGIGEEDTRSLVRRLARIDGISLSAGRGHVGDAVLRYDEDGAGGAA